MYQKLDGRYETYYLLTIRCQQPRLTQAKKQLGQSKGDKDER